MTRLPSKGTIINFAHIFCNDTLLISTNKNPSFLPYF